eukprot:CAMPEP_0179868454 /NCGR_PEP_ID=MMETSP0982-20121206/18860_1 /TAXON_ID=483367 /ORGANISM="non described non described, Strain CCMP 2436" /LENGTH=221 /DNA_ID=CAMNT_0021758177 /DNA_START=162 /DNA_END=827 /DNA_ORIENTATION=-
MCVEFVVGVKATASAIACAPVSQSRSSRVGAQLVPEQRVARLAPWGEHHVDLEELRRPRQLAGALGMLQTVVDAVGVVHLNCDHVADPATTCWVALTTRTISSEVELLRAPFTATTDQRAASSTASSILAGDLQPAARVRERLLPNAQALLLSNGRRHEVGGHPRPEGVAARAGEPGRALALEVARPTAWLALAAAARRAGPVRAARQAPLLRLSDNREQR